ncbi:hypothetical protein [Limnobacter sp.]|uniref:hypothetical protein n=1 Tax=Limnobacter sp. TaxID=2003368 RepID=UPI00258977B8|nr:hypothetical protein [Limnobacter sp.]
MSTSTPLKLSQGFEVLRPRSDKALPIPCNEWDVLKSQIGELTTEPWLFHTLGSMLLGASLATFISVITGAVVDSSSAKNLVVIAWATTVVCGVTGVACMYFAHKERAVHKAKAGNVATQMRLIEERFDREEI